MPQRLNLFDFRPQPDQGRATLTIDPAVRSPHRVSPYLFGKFCEHLGFNIYQGMEAEILFNPTFGQWLFNATTDRVNGGMAPESDLTKIAALVATRARRLGFPDAAPLYEDWQDALAFGWFRLGTREEVRVSADAGPHGSRAQRVEVLAAPGGAPRGVAQWTYLPLHRTRGYEYRVVARAADPVEVTLSLGPVSADGKAGEVLAQATLSVEGEWKTFEGRLDIPADAEIDPEGLYLVAVTTSKPANLVVDRVLLYPDDHVEHLDPDVIRMLRDAKLPLLRWPGGNFVSGYHWRHGVGPVDARPTEPNPAWESLEYNLFGTDEFMAFCRAVGCEPMICVNAGNGTPQEAADWVEYCNGSTDTSMGRLRAENGHPEPYNVRLWEIGNELDGRHQVSWTTAGGYADRYRRFVEAMKAVDPAIRFLACGAEWRVVGTEWNGELIRRAAPELTTLTHHVLNGGMVNERTDRMDLFHSFMGYATPLGDKYLALAKEMEDGGVRDPKVAITELQLFAHYTGPAGIGPDLSPATMPTNSTISEALYVAAIIHEAIRLGDLVELITHSATVNHGGGLRKMRERVFGNPIHYGHVVMRALADGTPVKVALEGGTYSTKQSFDNGVMPQLTDVPALDAVAVLAEDGTSLIVSLVHRSATAGPITLDLNLGGLKAKGTAEVLTLAGAHWWDENTLQEPERVSPCPSQVAVRDGVATLVIQPYSLTRVTIGLQ